MTPAPSPACAAPSVPPSPGTPGTGYRYRGLRGRFGCLRRTTYSVTASAIRNDSVRRSSRARDSSSSTMAASMRAATVRLSGFLSAMLTSIADGQRAGLGVAEINIYGQQLTV